MPLFKDLNSRIEFDRIITVFVLRKFLVKVLHSVSNFKTTEGILMKLNTFLRDHSLRSLSKINISDMDFDIFFFFLLQKFLVTVLRATSNFDTIKNILMKFYTYLL